MYKIVDLRNIIPGSPVASQGSKKKTKGGVQHYNGDPNGYTGVASGSRSPIDVYKADARYHMSKDWGGGYYTNGVQYHYGCWDDTIYILRNPDSCLWHCGDGVNWNTSYNYNATAVNVPISAYEKANPRTIQTLIEFWTDELKKQGRTDRNILGHQEVPYALSTACPGPLMNQFVLPYRLGNIKAPNKVEQPENAPRWINIGYHPEDKNSENRAKQVEAALKVVGFKVGATSNIRKALIDGRTQDGVYGLFIGNKAIDTLEDDKDLIVEDIKKTNPNVWAGFALNHTGAVRSAVGGEYNGKYYPLKEVLKWRITSLCDEFGADKKVALDKYNSFDSNSNTPNTPVSFTPGPDLNSQYARKPYDLVGAERFSKEKVKAWAKNKYAHSRTYEMIDAIYDVVAKAWKANGNPVYAADMASIQFCHETGFGHYNGDSKAWNPAGIKLSGRKGDTPSDFEVPSTAYEGARMLINHMSVYIGGKPYGTPHGRYNDIKNIRWNVASNIDDLTGTWAMDPNYAIRLKKYINELEGAKEEPVVSNPSGSTYKGHKWRSWHTPKAAKSSGSYIDIAPTRWHTDMLEETADICKYIEEHWNVTCFTYVPGHPMEQWAINNKQHTVSFDVWGPEGRGYFLDSTVHEEIFDWLFNKQSTPIRYIIKRGGGAVWDWMWVRGKGWEKYYSAYRHDNHIHTTLSIGPRRYV